MLPCHILQLGLIGYASAWDLQRRLVEMRKAEAIPDVLLLCEHPHVITLGRNGKREHLRASDELLREMGIEFCHTDRGGDITYHGPGQLVGYPIIKLLPGRQDIRQYVRDLQEVLIRAVRDFGVEAEPRGGDYVGVWVGQKKLAAIGIRISRWVTMHGFALNVTTDLQYFQLIVPCGISPDSGHGVTSLHQLTGKQFALQEVAERVTHHFGEVFNRSIH